MKRIRMSSSLIRLSWRLVVWGLATWLVLSLHDAPIAQQHSICGPWGCGPTIPALLSAHGFWLFVGIPGALWAGHWLGSQRALLMGWFCLAIGVGGLVAVILGELATWPVGARPESRAFLGQRILFALATTVEVPIIPTAIAGLILLRAGRRPTRMFHPTGLAIESEAMGSCSEGLCDLTTSDEIIRRSGLVEIGKPLPDLTLIAHDGRALEFPTEVNRPSLFYFMRASGCSICKGHVRNLARMIKDHRIPHTDVFIVHPDGFNASRILQNSTECPFTVGSGRDFRAYDAIGLSGRNFGLSRGSGTILVDGSGVVRYLRLANLPFGAFSESELIDAYASLTGDGQVELLRARIESTEKLSTICEGQLNSGPETFPVRNPLAPRLTELSHQDRLPSACSGNG